MKVKNKTNRQAAALERFRVLSQEEWMMDNMDAQEIHDNVQEVAEWAKQLKKDYKAYVERKKQERESLQRKLQSLFQDACSTNYHRAHIMCKWLRQLLCRHLYVPHIYANRVVNGQTFLVAAKRRCIYCDKEK